MQLLLFFMADGLPGSNSSTARLKNTKCRVARVSEVSRAAPEYFPLLMKEPVNIEKRYYSIGEVAERFGVATSLIRYWETHFDTIKPRKNKNGARQYTKNDIEAIQLIYHLVKEKGYTLNGAKETLKSGEPVKGKLDAIEKLGKVKAFLLDLKKNL